MQTYVNTLYPPLTQPNTHTASVRFTRCPVGEVDFDVLRPRPVVQLVEADPEPERPLLDVGGEEVWSRKYGRDIQNELNLRRIETFFPLW